MAAKVTRGEPSDVRDACDTERMDTSRALADRLAELLSRERGAMAEFLVALADFDRKRAWADLGFANLFWFLHRELGLSMGAAHYRKVAAWLIQKHPEVVQPLRDGRLCLTSIVELAKVLTVENSLGVLPRYFHLSRREAAEVSAAIRPVEQPPLREVVTTPTTTSTSPRCDTDVAFHVFENHPAGDQPRLPLPAGWFSTT